MITPCAVAYYGHAFIDWERERSGNNEERRGNVTSWTEQHRPHVLTTRPKL